MDPGIRELQRCQLAHSIAVECLAIIQEKVSDLGEIRSYSAEEKTTLPEHCIWMCERVRDNFDQWSPTMSHRWLGFIQGVMVANGWTTTKELRRIIRRLKQSYHE
jgi:hypothetical protein